VAKYSHPTELFVWSAASQAFVQVCVAALQPDVPRQVSTTVEQLTTLCRSAEHASSHGSPPPAPPNPRPPGPLVELPPPGPAEVAVDALVAGSDVAEHA